MEPPRLSRTVPSRVRLALAVALLALQALPAVAAAAPEAPYEGMAVDDSWISYFEHQIEGGKTSTTTTLTYVGQETIIVRGIPRETMRFEETRETRSTKNPDAYRIDAQTTWRLAADGAIVKEKGSTTLTYPPLPVQAFGWTRTFTTPCVMWQWPLVVGAEWTARCSYVLERDGAAPEPGETNVRHKVIGTERVDVPAGTFDAWIVEVPTSHESIVRREWYAPDACAVVRSGSFQDGKPQFSFTELQEFRCARKQAQEPVVPTPATPPADDNETSSNSTQEPPAGNATDGSPANETAHETPANDPVNETPANETANEAPANDGADNGTANETAPPAPAETPATPTAPTQPAAPTSNAPEEAPPAQGATPPATPEAPGEDAPSQPPTLPATPAAAVDVTPEADPAGGAVIAGAEHGHPDGMPGKSVPLSGLFVAALGVAIAALALARRER